MEEFALWRGGQVVPDEAWRCPIARRLFQYFTLHQGELPPRDCILEDFWPREDPQRAQATFRTVYSGLQRVLESYLVSRAPFRYVAAEGEVYCFDPHHG